MNESHPYGVCVVYYNEPAKLIRLIESIDRSNPRPSLLTVVDNASEKGAQIAIEASAWGEKFDIEVVRMQTNSGFAAAFNAGSRNILDRGLDVWVNCSHDCVVEPSSLGQLAAKAATPMTLAGPIVKDLATGRIFSSGGYINPWTGDVFSKTRPVMNPVLAQWLDGSCFAIGRSLFDQLGGMDEEFFLYFEDVDLGLRTREAGGSVWVLPVTTFQEPRGPDAYLRGYSSGLLARRHLGSVFGISLILRNLSGSVLLALRGRWTEGLSRGRGLSRGLRGIGAAY